MLKDVALSTGVFAGAVVGVAVGSAGGFTGAEGVVGAGFAGAFLLLTVTLHLYVFLPTLALISDDYSTTYNWQPNQSDIFSLDWYVMSYMTLVK